MIYMIFILAIIIISSVIFLKIKKEKTNQVKEQEPKTKLSYKEKIEKGRKYEYQIFNFFKEKGYKAYPNGYIKKSRDGGIDILAYKDNEILIIQCKNWANSPKQKDIKAFIVDSDEFIKKNENLTKDKTIRKLFITSNSQKDYGVAKFLDDYNKENKIKVEYVIVQYLTEQNLETKESTNQKE